MGGDRHVALEAGQPEARVTLGPAADLLGGKRIFLLGLACAIVANVATPDPAAAKTFYEDVLGLEPLMDFGWIRTSGSPALAQVQISFASEGGGAKAAQ